MYYEYIDNLHFIVDIENIIGNWHPYKEIARNVFKAANWKGDGNIGLLWIPPFALASIVKNVDCFSKLNDFEKGLAVWYVKQDEDGDSFILSPIELNLSYGW
jgi:hypothetical protein